MQEMEITRRCCKRHSRGTKDLAFHQMTFTKKKKKLLFFIRGNVLKERGAVYVPRPVVRGEKMIAK